MRKYKLHYPLYSDRTKTLCGRAVDEVDMYIIPGEWALPVVTCKSCLKILRSMYIPVSETLDLPEPEFEEIQDLFSDKPLRLGRSESVKLREDIDWGFWGIVLIVTIVVLSVIIWG